MQLLDYIPSSGKTRGAKRGESMKNGFIRKHLYGDIRKSDGWMFFAYRWKNGKYQENWRSPESFNKSLKQTVAYSQNYRALKPEKVKKSRRNWVVNNREKYNQINYRWMKNHPDKTLEFSGKRRARQINATLMIGRDQQGIIDSIYQCSVRVSKCTGIKHHVDHIIPLSKGGYHIPPNLQVLPAVINMRKRDKLPSEFMARFPEDPNDPRDTHPRK